MGTLEQFRHKLARRLRVEAARRRQVCAGDPSGQDLKVITLCETLAADAEHLPALPWRRLRHACADAVAAQHLAEVWEDWPEALGVTLWPRSAAEVVDWMRERVEHDGTALPSRRLRVAATVAAPRRPGAGLGAAPTAGWGTAFATDFTAGLGIAAPALAAWQVSVGVGQWRDRAVADHHPAVTAEVIAVTAGSGGRDIRPPASATLSFVPAAGQPACHVAVPVGGLAAGATLAVVPRETACTAPVVPGAIGDPATSFTLAAAFLLSGLAALAAWSRLSRGSGAREPEPATPVPTVAPAIWVR